MSSTQWEGEEELNHENLSIVVVTYATYIYNPPNQRVYLRAESLKQNMFRQREKTIVRAGISEMEFTSSKLIKQETI